MGIHSPGFVGETDEEAIEASWPYYHTRFGRIGRERGWPPTTKDRFVEEVRHGSQYVGSAETVARKIAATMRDLKIDRFDLKYSTGPMPHDQLMRGLQPVSYTHLDVYKRQHPNRVCAAARTFPKPQDGLSTGNTIRDDDNGD